MSNALMDLLKAKRQSMTAHRRAKTVKPEEGTSRWRILPGWDAKNPAFWHDFGQHFIKDASNEIKAVYICVDKTYGKPCSVCDALNKAINNSSDDQMVELLKGAKSSQRVLMNALHISGQDPSVPVILEVAPTVFLNIMDLIQKEWGPELISLDEGRDIIIERVGKGKLTKYSLQPASKSVKVDPSVMKKITNLDEYVAQESEDNAKRALNNLSSISGYLPSSPRLASIPSHAASLREISIDAEIVEETDSDDEALRALEQEVVAAPAAKVEAPVAAKAPVAPVVKPTPAKAPVAESTGDADLDSLLAELGG